MENQLREIANTQYDKYDFAGARETYRALILSEDPTGKNDLAALSEVENYEVLAFRTRVLEMYPTSLDAHLAKAEIQAWRYLPYNAALIYIRVLENFDLETELHYQIQVRLFDILCGEITTSTRFMHVFLELLRYLWSKPENSHWQAHAVRMLIENLHRPDAKGIVQVLLREDYFPTEVLQLFQLKCDELDALLAVEEVLKNMKEI